MLVPVMAESHVALFHSPSQQVVTYHNRFELGLFWHHPCVIILLILLSC
jgi:hypothetical protein